MTSLIQSSNIMNLSAKVFSLSNVSRKDPFNVLSVAIKYYAINLNKQFGYI